MSMGVCSLWPSDRTTDGVALPNCRGPKSYGAMPKDKKRRARSTMLLGRMFLADGGP